ncbi:hypothetical protein OPV22_005574 [Ensete ventricosum]|uniref:Uncharacterized protein n=1 Tax=Ensete ventricosum TaxID=4639 RepID=A0AAV8RRD2_ENSVE|nr:hypothetical protein OPV22_005574 [Ensete ventricosum]
MNPKDKYLKMSTYVNMWFAAPTICVQSTVWSLGDAEATGRRYAVASGVKRDPGLATVLQGGVRHVGVFVEAGKRWLGLVDEPFPVMFKKAHPVKL